MSCGSGAKEQCIPFGQAQVLPVHTDIPEYDTTVAERAVCAEPDFNELPAVDKVELRKVEALRAACEEALESVSCRICLDSLSDPVQMRCGHFFCADCVDHLFASRATQCPLCKHAASKRGNRNPGVPVSQIVSTLQNLSLVVQAVSIAVDESRLPTKAAVVPVQPSKVEPPGGFAAGTTLTATAEEVAASANKPCALCPPKVPPSFIVPNLNVGLLRPSNPHAPVSKANPRVHEECAFFASTVYDRSDCFVNVEKTVRTSRNMLCQYEPCNRGGASVVCAAEGCEMRFHYVCAVKNSCAVCTDGSYAIFCPAHRELAPQLDMDDFEMNEIDANGTQGRETADECFVCGKGGNLLLCDGANCFRAYHVGCAEQSSIPEGTWLCGICRGTHVPLPRIDDNGNSRISAEENTLPAPPAPVSLHSKKSPESSASKRKRGTSANRKRASLEEITENIQNQATPSRQVSSKPVSLSGPPVDYTYKRRRSSPSLSLLPTALSEDSLAILKAVQRRHKSFTIATSFSKRVTHVLCTAFGMEDIPKRTVKLCKGIVANLPIVCLKWVDDAFNCDTLPSFDAYLHPLSRLRHEGPLFNGTYFHFGALGGSSILKEDLLEIVKAGKGSLLVHEPTADSALCRRGNIYLVRGKAESFSRYRRQSQLPSQIPPGCTLVTPEWILDECTRQRPMTGHSE